MVHPSVWAERVGAQMGVMLVVSWAGWDRLLTCLLVTPPLSPGLPMYIKSLRWALAIMAVLLAVSTVAIVALASRTGMVPPPGPLSSLFTTRACSPYSTFVRIRKRHPGKCRTKSWAC